MTRKNSAGILQSETSFEERLGEVTEGAEDNDKERQYEDMDEEYSFRDKIIAGSCQEHNHHSADGPFPGLLWRYPFEELMTPEILTYQVGAGIVDPGEQEITRKVSGKVVKYSTAEGIVHYGEHGERECYIDHSEDGDGYIDDRLIFFAKQLDDDGDKQEGYYQHQGDADHQNTLLEGEEQAGNDQIDDGAEDSAGSFLRFTLNCVGDGIKFEEAEDGDHEENRRKEEAVNVKGCKDQENHG